MSRLRFPTVILVLSLSVLLASITLESSPVQNTMTYGEYGPYLPEYYPYSTYVSHAQYYVTIEIFGLPPEYFTGIKIDGTAADDVRGGSSKNFQVRSTEAHVFEAEGQILGPDGTRYVCREPSWSLEQTQSPYVPYAYYHYPYVNPWFDYFTTKTTTTTTTTTSTTTTTTTETTTTTTSSSTEFSTTTSETTTTDTTTTTSTDTTTTESSTTTDTSTTETTTSTTESTTTTDSTTSSSTESSTTTSETTSTDTTTTETTTTTTESTTSSTSDTTTTTESQSSPADADTAAAPREKDDIIGVSEKMQRTVPFPKSDAASGPMLIGDHKDSAQYNPYFDTYPDGYSHYYPSAYYYPYYPNYYPWYGDSTLEASHAFIYEPEYLLSVENPHGASIDKAGWKRKDSVITLSTPEKIEKSEVERSLFETWSIDGSEVHSSTVTLTMNMPHRARATYQPQYYLEVKSELGQPQGSGWYDKGSSATISVSSEVPMPGFWASLGGRYVFDNWSGLASGDRYNPSTTVVVDQPTTVVAVWRADYSAFNTMIAVILILLIVLLIVGVVVATRGVPQLGGRRVPSASDTLDLRYGRGEITREEYLRIKKDIGKT